ncbi:type VI secretion system baseplate subunit TssF [Roseibium polysiphoniae]|uniref:Type VI secretion system baseplate subunit TssF n=1 Tax=Roseibium polysiphoniae TaxID=2571221 RepID=A0A944GUP3_9HYPH|nr:type VI secretion system baseplate subunit TssF [Roseibium polysiphoniae]MBS8262597.1 type VI secretion system baseplate subunit TssF [Roseibium polysiphoniae]
MSVNSYYRDELNYLREMGKHFAKANPRLTKYLGEDASDPDVERLLEGFAFLVGRLRQRLDAEMPEVSQSLLKLIWPHYLRPVAPITTMQFRYAPGAGEPSINVPAGTSVQTAALDGRAVQFRTSFGLKVLPLEISSVELENRKDSCKLSVKIKRLAGSNFQIFRDNDSLQLFLNGHGDDNVARNLYMYFLRKLRKVEFSAKGGVAQAAGIEIEPVGFADNEATLPYPPGAFQGFRIMQEYFSCPEKFMYVRLKGLAALADVQTESVTLVFHFGHRFSDVSRLNKDHIVLNATPAINLFDTEGQALLVSHDRSEYPVRPVGGNDAESVHAVTSVTGWVQGSGEKVDYEEFESFAHDGRATDDQKFYYRTQIRPSVIGDGVDHYISFVTRLNEVGLPSTETVSLRLLCSNGKLAGRFGLGSVVKSTSSTPAKLEFSNVTPILTEVPPPLDDRVLWTLIANLSRNYASLIDVEALRTVISAYDFRANIDKQGAQQRDLLLQSLQRFERRGVDIFRQGRPVRAFELALTVSESLIGGEAEMFLFGSVLDQFLKSYSSINSLHRFSITGLDSNAAHHWTPKWGGAASL